MGLGELGLRAREREREIEAKLGFFILFLRVSFFLRVTEKGESSPFLLPRPAALCAEEENQLEQ